MFAQGNSKASVKTEDHAKYVVLSAGGTSVTISKTTGLVDYLDVDGKPMFEKGYSLKPNFWRAATDNDFGADLPHLFAAWKNPELKLKNFEIMNDGSVKSTIDIPETESTVTLTYTLNDKGELLVEQDLKVNEKAENKPELMRFGMQLQMPKEYGEIEFYGKGPNENYPDRNESSTIGLYRQKVADQYYPYVRPQESGTKTQVRYWKVRNHAGIGLMFYAEKPLECSSLNYLMEDLDPAPVKQQWHSGDLTPRNLTSVFVSLKQSGLGCINTWGARPEAEYLLPYQDYSFKFMIKPIK